MIIYNQLKEEFEENIEILQRDCKHPIYKLKIEKDHSVVGRGSILPRIDIICKICNIKWVIFQDLPGLKNKKEIMKIWKQMSKEGAMRCNWSTRKKHFIFMDTGTIPEHTQEERARLRLPYKRMGGIRVG